VFHDLRHTAVALAIAEGAHPKAIQARLGHASITMTLNTYGHLFPSLDVELADRLDAVCADRLAARGGRSSWSRRPYKALTSGLSWWALEDSNLRPLGCKASALPLS
jgi:hypothetical protein